MGSSQSSHELYDSYVESKFNDLSGKVVAITGTSPGSLGYHLAKAAVAKNAKCVLLLNRQSERAVKAEEDIKEGSSSETTVKTITTDLLSFASVREASAEVNKIAQENGGLDVLACNAGIMASADKRSDDGHDVQMQANQLSQYLLSKLCMKSLEQAASARGEARVVTHSSSARFNNSVDGMKDLESKYFQKCEAGSLGGDGQTAPWARYHQTKLANSAFAMALHDKLQEKGSKVKALSCDPGLSATNLQTSAEKGGMMLKALMFAAPLFGAPQSPADGSLDIGMCCFGPDSNSGDFYMPSRAFGAVGDPKKSISGGVPIKDGSETETVSEQNKKVVMEECEKLFGTIF